jgi:chromosomal replication initiation ATPase DnaA
MWDEIPPSLIPARHLETLVARLQKEADRVDVKLPTDAALYIARNVRLNARALEDALRRVIAYSSLAGTEISLAYTQKVLKSFIDEEGHEVALDSLPELTSQPSAPRKPKSDSIVRLRRIGISVSVCWKGGMGEKPAGFSTNWK